MAKSSQSALVSNMKHLQVPSGTAPRQPQPDHLQDPLQDPLASFQALANQDSSSSDAPPANQANRLLNRPGGSTLATVSEDDELDVSQELGDMQKRYRIQVDDLDAQPQDQAIRYGQRGSVHQQQDTMEDLYASAANASGPFKDLVEGLVASTHAVEKTRVLKPYDRKAWVKEHPNEPAQTFQGKYVEVEKKVSAMGPMKDQGRAKDKADQEYDGDVSKLLDIVRATLVYKDCAGVLAALDAIQANKSIQIARAKNKMDANGRGALGYGDVTLNLQINDHICELQLQVEAMAQIKPALHGSYDVFRTSGKGQGIKDVQDPQERAKMTHAAHDSQNLATSALVALNRDPNYEALMKRLASL